jgi:SnoaL-like domain
MPGYVVHDWRVQEQFIDVDGDCAAVLQRGFQRATVHGQARDGLFIVSDIWRRREGVWRIWRRHSSPLSAGEMPSS